MKKRKKKIKYKIRHQLFLFLLARLLSRGMQHSYSSEILILADIRVYHRQIWAVSCCKIKMEKSRGRDAGTICQHKNPVAAPESGESPQSMTSEVLKLQSKDHTCIYIPERAKEQLIGASV